MPERVGKGLARDWKLEINISTTGTPQWVSVKGLRTNKMTIDGTEVDSSDLDSGVWGGKFITGRDWSIECEGAVTFTVNAAGVKTYDPAQEFLRELALEAGWEAQVEVRRVRRDTGIGHKGWANVHLKDSGGGNRDLDPFNLSLSGDGPLTPVTATP